MKLEVDFLEQIIEFRSETLNILYTLQLLAPGNTTPLSQQSTKSAKTTSHVIETISSSSSRTAQTTVGLAMNSFAFTFHSTFQSVTNSPSTQITSSEFHTVTDTDSINTGTCAACSGM